MQESIGFSETFFKILNYHVFNISVILFQVLQVSSDRIFRAFCLILFSSLKNFSGFSQRYQRCSLPEHLKDEQYISHFRVAFCLCVKTSLCAKPFMKMCCAYRFIFMQTKLIFIWKVLNEDSFWNRHKKGTAVTQKWLIGPTHEIKTYHDEGHTQNIPTDWTALQILLMNPDLQCKNNVLFFCFLLWKYIWEQ